MSDDMSVKEGVESAELSEKGLSLPPRALLNCTHSTCTDNLYRCSPPYQNEPHNSGHHAIMRMSSVTQACIAMQFHSNISHIFARVVFVSIHYRP